MASDYTTNYNLDKYVATDKPNLRDQYNAAMDKIDSALLAANNTANQAYAKVDDFDGDIAAVNTAVNNLSAKLPASSYSSTNTVAAAISGVSNRVTALENAQTNTADTVLLIGDSFSNLTARPYAWNHNLATALDCKVETRAASGAGFARTDNKLQTLLEAATTPTANLKYAILVGGINDIRLNYSLSQIESAINTFISVFKSKYPNKMLYVFCPNGSRVLTDCFSLRSWGNTMRNLFIQAGFPAWNLQYAVPLIPSYFDTDDLHPNSNGMKILRSYILGALKGPQIAYRVQEAANVNLLNIADGYTAGSNTSIQIYKQTCSIKFDVSGDLVAGQNVIGDISYYYPNVGGNYYYTIGAGNIATDGKLRYFLLQPSTTTGKCNITVGTNTAVTNARVLGGATFEL